MAARHDITIEQGATFAHAVTWSDAAGDPVDLTGFEAHMQGRPTYDNDTPFLELTTGNGGIVLTPLEGLITLNMSAGDTALLPLSGGVYDLELKSAGGVVTRLLMGTLAVSAEVTRDA